MQKFKIEELKAHPRNREFFDDMSGEKWNEFLESIKTSGVIEPIVVTQDKIIVSGHQRVRACKELGIEEIDANVKIYDSDDDIIKDLLETNIRQRGEIGGSTVKLGRRIKELERIYGIHNGGNDKVTRSVNSSSGVINQKELANKLGISLDILKRAKTIANLPQEIQDLVEQGSITPSTAARVISKLSDGEQAELIETLPATKKYTQKEVEGYIDKLREKDNQIAGYEKKMEKLHRLESEKADLEKQIKEQKPVEIIKEVEVKPKDYDDIKLSNKTYKTKCKNLEDKYAEKIEEIMNLKQQIKTLSLTTGDERKAQQKMIDDTNYFCNQVNNFVHTMGGYVWISDYIDELPKYEKSEYLKAIKLIVTWASNTEAYVQDRLTNN